MRRFSAGILAMCGISLAFVSKAYSAETIAYSYDALGRLVATSSAGSVNNGQNVSIAYDAADNRSQFVVSGVAQPTLSISPTSATEGGTLSFTVTLSSAATGTVTVNYATSNGTAVAPGDYTSKSGTLTFTSGQTSKTITVVTIDNTAYEPTETMTVTLSSPAGAVIGTSSATGTIIDNDTSIATLSIGNASVTEGGSLAFVVTRTGNTANAVSATYSLASGTATAGSDFSTAGTPGTVSFSAAQITSNIIVPTVDDALIEPAETMTVALSSPSSGAVIGTATGTGTINDNDTSSLPEFTIDDASGTEGGTLVMNITRSGNTSVAVSINVSSASGTATKGSDFSGTSGIIGFGSGQTSAFATYNLLNNSTSEPTETFTVTISPTSAGTATILRGTATGTIFDDD